MRHFGSCALNEAAELIVAFDPLSMYTHVTTAQRARLAPLEHRKVAAGGMRALWTDGWVIKHSKRHAAARRDPTPVVGPTAQDRLHAIVVQRRSDCSTDLRRVHLSVMLEATPFRALIDRVHVLYADSIMTATVRVQT